MRVAFEYWEDSLLGGFYDPDRPGDIPVYHLVIYKMADGGWGQVYDRPTRMDTLMPNRTMIYWAEKIVRAMETRDPAEAARRCPFVNEESLEGVAVG